MSTSLDKEWYQGEDKANAREEEDEEDDYESDRSEGSNGEARKATRSGSGQELETDTPSGILPPPAPLYFDRSDAEWTDDDEQPPQTGTPINLRHPPPQFLQTCPAREPLGPTHVPIDPEDYHKVMSRLQDPVAGKCGPVSESGYPIGNKGTLVYDQILLNAKRRVSKGTQPFYTLTSEGDHTLQFDSLFESGNLYQAYQVGDHEYELVMKNDYNTNGHTQWYYFQVRNMRKGVPYKFNICNFYKRSSMYSKGLLPLMYSEKLAKDKQLGWHRAGVSVSYRRNDYLYCKKNSTRPRAYYSLQFTVEFQHGHDTCYFSHCYPYTYTDLQLYLSRIEADSETRKICRRKCLTRTMAGNRCDILTITTPRNPDLAPDAAPDERKKKAIVLSARVHPGETNASWMIKGAIDFLLSGREDAQRLRDRFVFKVVPMLNPDGVINGNYRTGLAGMDLNRKWRSPDRALQPTVYAMKDMMCRVRDERGIDLFLDYHGHSVKNNIFIYGCDAKYWSAAPVDSSREEPKEMHSRIFPAQLDSICPMFSYEDCRFHVKRRKETSGRVVCWREFTNNSYTLESSFGGGDKEHEPANGHLAIADYEKMGADVCRAICQVLCVDDESLGEIEARLLEKVGNMVIPEEDSDDEGAGGEDGPPSSDDDSDDDTVDNPVLPPSAAPKRPKPKAKKKAKKKEAPKPAPPPPEPEPEVKPAPPPPAPKPAAAPPPVAKKKEEEKPECKCPSCLVYAEFIASGPGSIGKGGGAKGGGGRR